jgi:hypothetical protein
LPHPATNGWPKHFQQARSFLLPRQDQLQPQNLDLTMFILARTIKTLIHGALIDRPKLLKNGELEQEIMTMLSAYLVKR